MLDIDEIQGNVVYAYGPRYRYARYILLKITGDDEEARKKARKAARETLRALAKEVTFGRRPTGRDGTRGNAPHLNIAFTYAGLRELEVDDATLAAFPQEFQEPEFKKSGEAAGWRFGTDDDCHVLLVVHATTCEGLGPPKPAFDGFDHVVDPLDAALLERSDENEPQPEGEDKKKPPVNESCNATLDREHFGFADGCSQPAIDGVHDDPVGGGIYARRAFGWWRGLRWLELLTEDLGIRKVPRRWRGIRAGEFVLGYENEDGTLPTGPGAPLGPNGTFMVYRQLHQNVPAFDEFVKRQARRLKKRTQAEAVRRARDEGPDPTVPEVDAARLIRAKIIGRWPDGTPLALSPDGEDQQIATNARRANNFLYAEDRDGYHADPEGLRCPLGAHVRRTNPRDALPGGGERTMRHRIIRRGMPYGERYDANAPGSEAEPRGLAFVCFSSSIHNGFEFIQKQWCDGGDAFGLGGDRDLLLQQGKGNRLTGMVVPGQRGTSLVLARPTEQFVTVLGCEYLFLPSRTACEWLTKAERWPTTSDR